MGEEAKDKRNTGVPEAEAEDVEARVSGFESSRSLWGDAEDLTSLTAEELKSLLSRFDEEEKALSYHRRVLQGRIDVIRAEIVRRGEASLAPEDLARVLMGDFEEGGGRDPHSDPDPERGADSGERRGEGI